MNHVVLARKYRPRSFEQMVGQAHVVQALGNALRSGRLHHAYLFTGTRGIGKTTVSRILAKSLNCTGPDGTGGVTAEPCGVCQACTEIDADRFIDYIELDAASNRSIDEIRELIERAAYKPSVGRYKVFMIDEAHQLTKDAFNALLKTLEEPPEYLKFVLATTDPEKMLPTVLSRCLQFNLRPMAPETVAEHLQQVLAAEGVSADAGAVRLLSRAARGSMRDALSLTDQAIAFGAGTLAEEGVRAMLGTVDRSHAAALVQALAGRDGAAVLATVAALREQGLSAAGTLEEMATLLQQMAVEQAVPGALDDSDPDTAGARQLAGELPPDETQLLYSIAVHGRAELSLLSDEYAALTMVLLRLLAFPPAGPAPAATAASRAAPLVASPREARSTAPARPVVTPARSQPGAATAAAARPPANPPAAAVPRPAPVMPAAPRAERPPVRPAPQRAAQEPPPWLDDEPPDDDGAAAAAAEADATIDLGDDEPTRRPFMPAPAPAPAAAPLPPLLTTALGDQWATVMRPLAAAGAVLAMVRELAWQAELLAVAPADGGGRRWQLRVERESLRNPSLAAKLAAAISAALGEPAQVEVVAGAAQDSLARRDAHARETAQREAEQVIHNDPVVRELMAQFRTARIVPGSIKPLTAGDGEPKAPSP
jgi:DNA polymerase-3 subunit gamma/tau